MFCQQANLLRIDSQPFRISGAYEFRNRHSKYLRGLNDTSSPVVKIIFTLKFLFLDSEEKYSPYIDPLAHFKDGFTIEVFNDKQLIRKGFSRITFAAHFFYIVLHDYSPLLKLEPQNSEAL